TEKSNWIDPRSNQNYSVQVQIPENRMASKSDLSKIPLLSNAARPVLGDVATIKSGTTFGEIDNVGPIPVLSVTANMNDMDLGTTTADVKKSIESIGE